MKIHFSTLDAIRGLAAIAVMILHYAGHNGLGWMPRAWMAVDLFFILSGFVLMHSYSEKIKQGKYNLLGFIKIRLIRLMPLYIIGLFLGYLGMVYSCMLPAGSCEKNVIPALSHGLFLLPYFTNIMWPFGFGVENMIFPLNAPAWSLFFELLVNLVFFYWLAKFQKLDSIFIVGIGFIGLLLAYFLHGSVNGGWGINNFHIGFPRVIYHFFIGILVYTKYQKYGLNSKLVAFISILLLMLAFAFDSSLVSMLTLFFLSPFVVLANAKVTLNGLAERICTWLGDISYPLYIVHWPIFQLLYLFGNLKGLTPSARVFVMSCLAIIFSWLLAIVDKKLRAKFSKKSNAGI